MMQLSPLLGPRTLMLLEDATLYCLDSQARYVCVCLYVSAMCVWLQCVCVYVCVCCRVCVCTAAHIHTQCVYMRCSVCVSCGVCVCSVSLCVCMCELQVCVYAVCL